jgi:hypothetical protein
MLLSIELGSYDVLIFLNKFVSGLALRLTIDP